MPEIWLNYGMADVVLDIKAENLDQKIELDTPILDDRSEEHTSELQSH